jgi:hypothetical protein
VVRDLELTPVSHSSTIDLLRLALNQPGYGIDELPMRKHRDVLCRMIRKLIQERLSSRYKVQERLGAFTIRERWV